MLKGLAQCLSTFFQSLPGWTQGTMVEESAKCIKRGEYNTQSGENSFPSQTFGELTEAQH